MTTQGELFSSIGPCPVISAPATARRYAATMSGESVAARVLRLYLEDGLSACQIAACLRRNTTPESVRGHLRSHGVGGVRWCPSCQRSHDIGS